MWWNAQNIIAGLRQVDESDVSISGDEDEEDDSDDAE
jgi:hypothetical protein